MPRTNKLPLLTPPLYRDRSAFLCVPSSCRYSTTTGNTETCAGYIADITGLEAVDIGDASDEDISAADSLICGAPTWHTGADEQRSGTEWDAFLYERLPNLDLSGKKVAIFGLGDQAGCKSLFCADFSASLLHNPFSDTIAFFFLRFPFRVPPRATTSLHPFFFFRFQTPTTSATPWASSTTS